MNDCKIEIRPFCKPDLDKLYPLQPKGWEDIVPYFKFYLNKSICYPLAAVGNGQLAGVANAILTGESGWLAHIIVSEVFRKQGLGKQLTKALIDYLRNAGCKVQHLIATSMGEGIYKKLEFRHLETYRFFQGTKISYPDMNKSIRSLQPSDWDAVMTLDKEITGEIRKPLLALYPFKGWVYFTAGKLIGYYLSEIGEGTILAVEVEAGLALLNLKHSLKACKTALPDSNRAGIDFFIGNEFEETGQAVRMVLGEKLAWNPESVYSRIGGFYA